MIVPRCKLKPIRTCSPDPSHSPSSSSPCTAGLRAVSPGAQLPSHALARDPPEASDQAPNGSKDPHPFSHPKCGHCFYRKGCEASKPYQSLFHQGELFASGRALPLAPRASSTRGRFRFVPRRWRGPCLVAPPAARCAKLRIDTWLVRFKIKAGQL